MKSSPCVNPRHELSLFQISPNPIQPFQCGSKYTDKNQNQLSSYDDTWKQTFTHTDTLTFAFIIFVESRKEEE